MLTNFDVIADNILQPVQKSPKPQPIYAPPRGKCPTGASISK
ncbi:MAG: hypothetical protein QNJ47_28410 [Nostocaceae cyanobacterium]|nr:hypothetical protein [Nostocaceae cyanobacterium]